MTSKKKQALLLLVLPAIGCHDLSSYSTATNEIYRGNIVIPEEVRKGFGSRSCMEMTLDIVRADSEPGRVTLRNSEESCEDEDGEMFFDLEPLYAIEPLRYDAMGSLDFPSGRVKTFIFSARISAGELAGSDAMVIVSLMSQGNVEVRVLAGGEAGRNRHYGVFVLEKHKK